MNYELAEEVAALAAPIYAALLSHAYALNAVVPAETLAKLRRLAITQAIALRHDVMTTEVP